MTLSAGESTGAARGGEPPRRAPRTLPVAACPLCGKPDAPVLFRAPDRLHGTPGEFTYRRCRGCGTVYQDPRVVPEDLSLCYPGDYYTHSGSGAPPAGGDPRDPAGSPLRRAVLSAMRGERGQGWHGAAGGLLAGVRPVRERVTGLLDEMAPRAAAGRRALDIGCGGGGLLRALRGAGWDVEGVEWDPSAAAVARAAAGCEVRAGDFRRISLPEGAFALVTMNHVFEHLDEPMTALRRVRALLRPGGRAVLVYPNPRAAGARWFGSAWQAWDPPRHLVLPPGRSLARRVGEAGLQVRGLRTVTRSPWAALSCAWSRSCAAGRADRDGRPAAVDRLAARVGALAARAGWGEEVVLVLERG